MIGQCPGCGAWMLVEHMLKRGESGATVRVCSASCWARVCGLPPLDPMEPSRPSAVVAKFHEWYALPSPDTPL